MAYLINMESFCERYSTSPEDLLNWDAYFLRAFQAILKGKSEGMKPKGDMGMTNKQMKKGFR